jgi:hypothetical protein
MLFLIGGYYVMRYHKSLVSVAEHKIELEQVSVAVGEPCMFIDYANSSIDSKCDAQSDVRLIHPDECVQNDSILLPECVTDMSMEDCGAISDTTESSPVLPVYMKSRRRHSII